jgi:hypothetical protein
MRERCDDSTYTRTTLPDTTVEEGKVGVEDWDVKAATTLTEQKVEVERESTTSAEQKDEVEDWDAEVAAEQKAKRELETEQESEEEDWDAEVEAEQKAQREAEEAAATSSEAFNFIMKSVSPPTNDNHTMCERCDDSPYYRTTLPDTTVEEEEKVEIEDWDAEAATTLVEQKVEVERESTTSAEQKDAVEDWDAEVAAEQKAMQDLETKQESEEEDWDAEVEAEQKVRREAEKVDACFCLLLPEKKVEVKRESTSAE